MAKALRALDDEVVGTYRSHARPEGRYFDMCDEDAAARLVRETAPDVIWVPGAMPDVDRCEREPRLSYAVNVKGPAFLMELAAHRKIPLVYFSSDYVFDGVDGPYRESDPVNPIQVYGQHKVEAERILLGYPDALVVRAAWIYSDESNPRNFIFRVLSALRQGSVLKAAIDQYNTPTPATPLAYHAVDALLSGYRGILHLTGPERMTRASLVARIARLAGYSQPAIELVRLGDLGLPALRPANGGLLTKEPRFAIQERLQDLDFSRILI